MQNRPDVTPAPSVTLGAHHPHCESATTEMLAPLIMSRFPADRDGITRIPYTLFGQRRVHLGSLTEAAVWRVFSSLPMPENYVTIMSDAITQALAIWTKISGNKVQFYPANNPYESNGIRFNLAPNSELERMGALAATFSQFDNSGYMKFADVYYSADTRFWDAAKSGDTYYAMTVNHEIEHALGVSADWPENSLAMTALRNTPDGVFCSIMPYLDRVTSDVSRCKSDCNPPYAMTPGATDQAMFKIAYQDDAFPSCYVFKSEAALNQWLSYAKNLADNVIPSMAVGACNGFVVSFGKNLAFTEPSQPSIPAKAVHIVADAGMLSAMIFLDMPVYECVVFSLSAATKYIPECVLQKLPETAQQVLTSQYSLYVLSLMQSLRKGHCLVPLVATAASGAYCTFVGSMIGEGIGSTLASGVSYLVRKIRYSVSTHAVTPQAEEQDIEAQNPAAEEPAPTTEKPAGSWWSRLFGKAEVVNEQAEADELDASLEVNGLDLL